MKDNNLTSPNVLSTGNSRILNRTGTCPRTIHYSMPKRDNRFEYQNLSSLQNYNPTIELRGTLNIRATPSTSKKEVENFRKMNVKNLPDTKRTLIPEANKEPDTREDFKRSKSVANMKKSIIPPGNLDFIMTRTDIGDKITPTTKHTYQRKGTSDVFCLQENRKYEPPKKVLHYNEFSKYTDTTQITYLPGGKKRFAGEIKDDEEFKKFSKKATFDISCQNKIQKDFNSNISCLRSVTPVSI